MSQNLLGPELFQFLLWVARNTWQVVCGSLWLGLASLHVSGYSCHFQARRATILHECCTVYSILQMLYFDTQQLLHAEAFTQKLFQRGSFYTQRLLHTKAFTHRSFYTQTLLHTDAFTHRSFYTQKLWRTDAFTHRSFYTQKLLHTDTFTHRRFYTHESPRIPLESPRMYRCPPRMSTKVHAGPRRSTNPHAGPRRSTNPHAGLRIMEKFWTKAVFCFFCGW